MLKLVGPTLGRGVWSLQVCKMVFGLSNPIIPGIVSIRQQCDAASSTGATRERSKCPRTPIPEALNRFSLEICGRRLSFFGTPRKLCVQCAYRGAGYPGSTRPPLILNTFE